MKKKAIIVSVIIGILLVAWFSGAKPSKHVGVSDKPVESSMNVDTPNEGEVTKKEILVSKEKEKTKEKAKTNVKAKTDEKQKSSVKATPDTQKQTAPQSAVAKKQVSPKKEVVTKKKVVTDKYLTTQVPQGKPKPVEPQEVNVDQKESFKVKMGIGCETLVENMDLLDAEKHELVPKDGVILPITEVTAYEGESVFDVLARETKKAKIHMEYVNTPIYNSAYIEGIHNLYEFDAGDLSGWMYKVNDWFPNYGCSRYQLQKDDVIEWVYTCDLGRDVGSDVDQMQESKETAENAR